MTLRKAAPEDAAAIETFLARHAETSMFLRANLLDHGIGASDHPHATAFWLYQPEGQPIRGVFGRTASGNLMVQAPDAPRAVWRAWAAALAGQTINGITGDDPQVSAALGALLLRVDTFARDFAEPLYRLDLDRLGPTADRLRRATSGDADLLTAWFTEYLMETGLTADRDRARAEAAQRAREAAAGASTLRLMAVDGIPVATASLNASVADMVQVGGVYVPPAQRNGGLGRRVTAARLFEAKEAGARTAILFAASPPAARAYEAIGFERIGAYRLSVLKTPLVVERAA